MLAPSALEHSTVNKHVKTWGEVFSKRPHQFLENEVSSIENVSDVLRIQIGLIDSGKKILRCLKSMFKNLSFLNGIFLSVFILGKS